MFVVATLPLTAGAAAATPALAPTAADAPAAAASSQSAHLAEAHAAEVSRLVDLAERVEQARIERFAAAVAANEAAERAAEAARVEAARVEAARVEAARIEEARLAEIARVEAARVETARVEAAAAEAARVAERAANTPAAQPASGAAQSGGWAALRRCESGGDYGAVSSSGAYRGAYQFSQSTWNSIARSNFPHLVGVDPAQAAATDQDAMAQALYRSSGSRPWPHCGRHLP